MIGIFFRNLEPRKDCFGMGTAFLSKHETCGVATSWTGRPVSGDPDRPANKAAFLPKP
jgi:hypothetical protein